MKNVSSLAGLFSILMLAAVMGSATLVEAAGCATRPSICDRSCWNAQAPRSVTYMSGLNRAIVHHTASTSDYSTGGLSQSKAKVRGVQSYHRNTLGWSDIGYHFLFDKHGNAFAGRKNSANKSFKPKGAHDGTNYKSFGFTALGYFHPPYNNGFTTSMKNKMSRTIAWRMPNGWSPYGAGTYNGKSVGKLDGHRKVKATACPGDKIFSNIGNNRSTGWLRNNVKSRINCN